MNYYDEIKSKIIDNEIYSKFKDYSKERNTIITYFEIGRLLNEAGGKYGDNIIGEYSCKLVAEIGKKYNKSTLFKMKKLYNVFNNEKVAPLVPQLTWSHCLVLIPLKDINEIYYYAIQVKKRGLTKRQLETIVRGKEYARLDETSKNKLINNIDLNIIDYVKDPILIKNSFNYKDISEKMLQRLIIENIESFMNELGNNFSFISSEYKIKIGDRYNYIDLLLFNIEFNCYVVIELKVSELKKEYIGQVEVYMNYIDKNLKKLNHDKTIGIIICKKDNKYLIEYCSDKRIISREYMLV